MAKQQRHLDPTAGTSHERIVDAPSYAELPEGVRIAQWEIPGAFIITCGMSPEGIAMTKDILPALRDWCLANGIEWPNVPEQKIAGQTKLEEAAGEIEDAAMQCEPAPKTRAQHSEGAMI